MCVPASGPFYRAAGMSYVRYANICADMLRNVMKEPYKTKAMQRQAITFRTSTYAADGKPLTQNTVELEAIPVAKQ